MELWEERREFFRVDGQVLLYHRKISETQRDELLAAGRPVQELSLPEGLDDEGIPVSDATTDHPPRQGGDVEALRVHLQRIETKLDLILQGFNTGLSKREDIPFEPCFVNISGCGMRFPTKECFEVGDCLEIMVLLPVMPGHHIHILGEVVHVLETEERACDIMQDFPYDTAVKFISLLEEDRELIVRYTFSQQARMIREHRA